MINSGLVLEGGGMRGAYTSGVLAAFMDEGIKFPYVIGVSAGASNGASFVAEQRDRNKIVFVDYVRDKEYSGFGHWLRNGSYFNMDFLYDKLPNELVPFDYNTFYNSETIFKACATHCITGAPVYFEKNDFQPLYYMEAVLRASSSLPIISKPIEVKGELYFDGGITDSIPIRKAIEDGNEYNVVILTRNKEYRKGEQKLGLVKKLLSRKYPKVFQAIKTRHIRYNATLDALDKLEKEGRIYIFRPVNELKVDRLERDISKLEGLYNQGYREAMDLMEDFNKWRDNVEKKQISKFNK